MISCNALLCSTFLSRNLTLACGLLVLSLFAANTAYGTHETALGVQLDFNAPESGDYCGFDLDLVGGLAIVGCPYGGADDTKGWAQIFHRNYNAASLDAAWEYQATLISTDPTLTNGEQFGYAVALDQRNPDLAVVSSLQNRTVYVFNREGAAWNEAAIIAMPTNNHFGIDVAASDGRIIVGTGANAAYVYIYNEIAESWTATPLSASGTKSSFGAGVGISTGPSGQYAVVGDPGADSVYFYEYDANSGQWLEKTAASKPGYSFGASVSIFGEYAIVGGPAAGGSTGSATVYHRDAQGNWNETAALAASDGAVYDSFGYAVDIGENYAIVSAAEAWSESLEAYSGVAYVFQRNGATWTEVEKIVAQDGDWYDYFGSAAALSENGDGVDFLIGAYARDYETGAVYARERTLVEHWMPGDADLDGDVDAEDAARLAENWLGDAGVAWADGDFNSNGIVDDADAALMAANWLYGVGDNSATAPEPATAVLMLMAIAGVALRRIKRR